MGFGFAVVAVAAGIGVVAGSVAAAVSRAESGAIGLGASGRP